MTGDVLRVAFGLALLLGGGDLLVRGASGLARGLGVSSLVVGLTVVAFGTSAPELAVNVLAALRGSGDISFGNIIGSNLANTGLIVGFTALALPIRVRRTLVRREIPMMIVASLAAVAMAFDAGLSGGAPESYDRGEGLVLLLLFAVFLYYTLGDAWRQRARGSGSGAGRRPRARPILARYVPLVVGGLVGLVYGADLTVDGAVGLARQFDVSEVLIGLTLVAVGTSLPELVTSVVAALRREPDLAIGNVVGSNIFNLLLVGGLTAVIRPIPVPAGGRADVLLMAGLAALLFLVSAGGSRRIIRVEAVLLLGAYLGYMVLRAFALLPM